MCGGYTSERRIKTKENNQNFHSSPEKNLSCFINSEADHEFD